MISKLFRHGCTAIKALLTRRVEILNDGISYRFEKVSLKKICNWLLVEASLYVKPSKPWGLPTHLQIEPGNTCNLKCALCPVNTGMKRVSGLMAPDLFRKVIDETRQAAFLILFWDWGEPFINPHAYEMIAYARKHDIKVVASTNGHLFAQPEHADKVVRSGLDTLIFAMDGITQESYERYRCGGRLETVLDGIRAVVAQKKALGSSTPLINLRFIVMKDNEHEIPRLKELAKSLGVDVLTFKTLNPGFGYGLTLDQDNRFIPEDPRYQRFSYDENSRIRVRQKYNPCKNLWNSAVVHWSGVLCPCCYDPDENYALGDLRSVPLKEAWSGEPYRKMRSRFHRDWTEIPLCRDCSNAYQGGSFYDETIVETIYFTQENFPSSRMPS